MDGPDHQLVEAIAARDEAALRHAIDLHGGAVYGMARRILVDADLAEEVAQDAFVSLWRRPSMYQPERGSLRSFVVGIARNKAIDLVRREEARRRAKDRLMDEMRSDPSSEVFPDEELEQREHVHDALASLSKIQREALVLAYYGGRTYREVAQELGIPEGTAKARLRDGLKKLRTSLTSDERRP